MVLSLALGWGTIYASRACLYPLFPIIAAELGVTSARAGFLASFYFILYTILQIPVGLLMDRVGTKRCLTAGYIFASLALVGTAVWGGSYGALLFFFGVQGLGDSFYYSGAQGTIVSRVKPERKAIASALLGIGMAVGVLSGLGFSHILYAALNDYRLPFLVMGILRFAVSGLLFYFVPDVPGTGAGSNIRDYLPLFRDLTIWKISGAMFFLMYGFWVMVNWGPTFLKAERNFVAEQAGFYSGLVALASIPGGLVWGSLSNRIGPKAVLLAALPLGGLFLFSVAGAGSSFPSIVSALLAFGFCSNSAVIPVAVVWVSRIAERKYPGKSVGAIAFYNCVIVASAVVAPVVSGFIRDMSGSLSGAIYLAAGSMLLSTLLLPGVKTEA